jgi:hypothetical protein
MDTHVPERCSSCHKPEETRKPPSRFFFPGIDEEVHLPRFKAPPKPNPKAEPADLLLLNQDAM